MPASAKSGVENAMPVRAAAGIASSADHDFVAPNSAITARKAVDDTSNRNEDEPDVPDDHVVHAQRRGEHRVVAARPQDRRHHGPRALAGRHLHGRRGEQPGARNTA